ncbi:ATP synthase mitochondrial F1 complex assembly factor 1 isoform X1 [Athalia rosae]|uniref:ATP synthase mitochondrial F1 complex assembly factor 1 isoform X1 n=1 Tax=Athalia rosae TaxID=37344 RepID=UPI00203462D4|nr:ATP synthase mitochondrial F1 complex assembly factor 1 isoform X1 [Athalia rosae]XP_048507078.1 ATP synthase mitochondrial F1 complex assembly factor 1 isoform X1 [Athalia rosae]XP_048507079.1 ATP synthase mitochondrial F1 complex assembly factor 1 isoform X1 [Athalia rosae]
MAHCGTQFQYGGILSKMKVALFHVGRKLNLINGVKNIILVQRLKRSIMTSQTNMEKALDELKLNPYFEKYAKKISKLQETSPEEFLSKIEAKEREAKAKKEALAQERKFQPASRAKPTLGGSVEVSQEKEHRLSDVMKVELIENKTRDEIINIWHEYHRQKDCISGAMTATQFDKLFKLAKEYPTFLLPLPRSQGYEFIMSQFHGTKIHMTPLLWYQVHKENAPECLSMTHYIELAQSKDLVLMRGEFDTKSINAQEAQCLANELQLYYSTDNPQRLKLLEKFTKTPDDFKYMDLITNLETISLISDAKVAGTS